MIAFFRLFLLLTLAGVSATAKAAERLDVNLVSEVAGVQPGQSFFMGLHLVHKKGYHTYWKFPGIVGVATKMDWKLPPGWKAEAITWPEPQRVMMFDIKAQGFRGDIVLPIRVTPPANLQPGTQVTLGGKASWMCCGRDCSPGFTDVSLSLPVVAEVTPDKKWSKRITEARALAPQPLKDWKLKATRRDKQLQLTLVPVSADAQRASRKIKDIIFFTEDGLVNPDKPQTLTKADDGTLVIEMEVSQYADEPLPKGINGVLQSIQGWNAEGAKSVSIQVPFTK